VAVPEPEPAPLPYVPPNKMVKVKFSIERQCEFGQHLNLVGAHPILGAWNIEDSVPMDWVEGCRWEVTVELPEFELVEYKYAVRVGWAPDGPAIWQGGPNFMVATNTSNELSIADVWVADDWGPEHPVAVATSAAVAVYALEHPKPEYQMPDNRCWIPEWAEDAVFYQIFPLGFFGAPSYNEASAPMVPRLALIVKHLDYLQKLGVTAVYFSPLFESDTHGYDTADYFQIDRRLGDVKLFKQVVDQCHARDIKVVLDGVFNHTGRRHFAFLDLQAKGPEKSEYANWYILGARQNDYEGWCSVEEGAFGFSYDCWEGHAMLPRLNLAEPAVRNHIFDVARYWLKDIGIDGWRLDVAHEISPDFWREFRTVCDEIDPNCLLVGEMIHGNYNNWVGNDRLHSGTNYQLSRAIWNCLNEANYDELMTALLREYKLYGGITLLNFLGNHDVARIASMLHEPGHYKLATAHMMLLPGVPCLYYGDELGMEGRPGEGDDPACGGDDAMRRPMLSPVPDESWPWCAAERLAITEQMIQIKKQNKAFQVGVMDVNACTYTGQQFIFIREAPTQKGIVVTNAANESIDPWPEVKIPPTLAPEGAVFKDVMDPLAKEFVVTNGMLYVQMDPISVRVLVYDVPPPKPKLAAAAPPVSKSLTGAVPGAVGVAPGVVAPPGVAAAVPPAGVPGASSGGPSYGAGGAQL